MRASRDTRTPLRVFCVARPGDCHPMSKSSQIALMSVMPLPAPDAGAPDWIHLLPAGRDILTADGRGPYHAPNLSAVIAASAGAKLPIDENHAIDIAAPRGEPSPARGHIVELQARADGLWGRAEWNASGRALLEDNAYLGISPVITHDAAMNVTGILRASLTNRPNLRGLTALHSQEDPMSLNERLAQLLGLDANSSEDSLVERITALHQSQTANTALQSSLSQIGTALGVAQDAKPDAIVAAAQAAGSHKDTVVPALQAQVTALQTQLTQVTTTQSRERAEAFVDGAKADRRIGITAENRDQFVAMHMADPVATEKLINGFPKMPETPALQAQRETVALQSDTRDLVSKARAHQAAQHAAGYDISWADAVRTVAEGK